MKISKNFNLSEFTASDTATKKGIKNIPSKEQQDNIIALVENVVQPLRTRFGRITINSGFRNAELNKAVGGVSTSNHMQGYACDMVFHEAKLQDVWDYLYSRQLPYQEAGLYLNRNFIHIAYNPKHVVQHKTFIGK